MTTGQTLKSAEFKWYRINDAGREVEYFNTKLENVKLVKVNPKMHDIKDPAFEKHNHLEQIELRYEKITGPTRTAALFIPIHGTNAPLRKEPRADGQPSAFLLSACTDGCSAKKNTNCLPDLMRFGFLNNREQRRAVACQN